MWISWHVSVVQVLLSPGGSYPYDIPLYHCYSGMYAPTIGAILLAIMLWGFSSGASDVSATLWGFGLKVPYGK